MPDAKPLSTASYRIWSPGTWSPVTWKLAFHDFSIFSYSLIFFISLFPFSFLASVMPCFRSGSAQLLLSSLNLSFPDNTFFSFVKAALCRMFSVYNWGFGSWLVKSIYFVFNYKVLLYNLKENIYWAGTAISMRDGALRDIVPVFNEANFLEGKADYKWMYIQ